MTNLRKVALWIADVVVRLASPAAKDWARATARELESIHGDWAALVWAMGSLRILLRGYRAPLASLADVPRAARQLTKEIRAKTLVGSAIALFEGAVFGYYLFLFRAHPLASAGSAMTALAALWFGYRTIAQRERSAASGEGPVVAEAYRSELERQRDFYTLRKLCAILGPLVAGATVFCVGMMLAYPKTVWTLASSMAMMLIFSGVAARNYRTQAGRYQRRIDEFDALVERPR